MTETIPVRPDTADPEGAQAPRVRPRSRGLDGLVFGGSFALVTALCAWLGYYTTFDSLAGWDDEGELLLTVKTFAHHGGLYTHIYSVFGPFYYEAVSTVFSWVPVTLDHGRLLTLGMTLLTSLGVGIAITIFTRNLLAGIVTQVGSFVLLILSYVDESMHPLILVWLLFAVALLALALIARGRRTIGCVALGATVAALVLTVVNVGAFAGIALLFTGLALAPPIRQMRLPRVAAAVLFIGTPFLLIVVAGGHTTESWALKYCFIVALSAAGFVVVTLDRGLQGLVNRTDAYRFLLGGGVLGVVVIVIAVASGTHPFDIVRGMLIDPARYSSAFTIPISVPAWTEVWGAGCLAGAFFYRRYRSRKSPTGLVDAWVHVAVGLLILYCAFQEMQLAFTNTFIVAMPLLFLAAIPPDGATDSQRIARVALVALAVLEGLLAYPVAGAQVRWSTLLMVPAGMLCLHDGVGQLRLSVGMANRRVRRVFTSVVASAALLAGLGWFISVFVDDLSIETNVFRTNTPLALPGSGRIRLPASQAQTLVSLSHAIRTQCSLFVTLPAMNSLYFWTEEETPTHWTNTWFYTRNTADQAEVLQRIEGADRSRFCVVDNPTWLSFWYQGHVLPQLPLARAVEKYRREHSPPQMFDDYRLYAPQDAPS